MIKVELLFGVVTFCLFVYCLVEVIQTPEIAMRNLPKVVWLLLVLFFPFVGSVAWLVAGRPESGPRRAAAYERHAPHFPEYDRPGRAAAVDPERDDDFLRQVRERAEQQRRRYDQERRARGQEAPPAAEGSEEA
ncbi:PLD nuclease N-terminal domain-containing protein [Nocardioides plantarum]|uniref:PLDc N-terminal domain-containing protein n=1 Tax=Nocardioides plantarum TaxID=29299 RepID=A0ABV5KER1_9ACTN|nr:PLD nuclease N-terminal domain-containing protein [Nocardioides plantarum]